MGTRGCVAVGTLEKWAGVYNHFDSYPDGLGNDVFEHIQEQITKGKSLEDIGNAVLRFDDWRNYLEGGICQYCGKLNGQPHTIGGGIYGQVVENGKYPDPEAKHHMHNDLSADNQITSKNPDPLFIEWVYVIDAAANTVHVLEHEHVRSKKNYQYSGDGAPPTKKVKAGWDYGHCVYKHTSRGTLEEVLGKKLAHTKAPLKPALVVADGRKFREE